MTVQRILLLVGSAKPAGRSTSEALARHLAARFERGGAAVDVLPVNRSRRAAEDARLVASVDAADLFMVVTPLYVDSLPYLVTRSLEIVAARRERRPNQRCACLVNCGFPEAVQCRTALAILECFARRTGFIWAGGLALGGGASIDGRSLERLGGMTRNLRAALDQAADALLHGEPVPAAAVAQLAKPMMPAALYTAVANLGWRWQASRHGVYRHLKERPY
jgi:NADPH-dependent FMN reductase